MFNLFRRNKTTIDSMSIPNFGWNVIKEDSTVREWINPEETMVLSIHFFNKTPDIPTIKKIDLIRGYYRGQIAEANGGLIQVDLLKKDRYKVIKTIFKIPQKDGIIYLTSLTIPFANCSYVIKLMAPQVGLSSKREKNIVDGMLKDGKVSVDSKGYVGWAMDPYLSDFSKGSLMNLSEKEEYDLEYPDHILSQSRRLIYQIEKEMELKEELQKNKAFKE